MLLKNDVSEGDKGKKQYPPPYSSNKAKEHKKV